MSGLREELAPRIVPVVLANLQTHYPYHDAHLTRSGEGPRDPIATHPAFGNSFDWHSSAHSHWTAMRLIEHFAERSGAPDALPLLQERVRENLTAPNVGAEIAYLAENRSYERPYGWAWALLLAAGATLSPHRELQETASPLRALGEHVAHAAVQWLQALPMPVRHGVHSNTAFALGLMYDASRVLRFTALENAIARRAREWFQGEREWPARWERSGSDFLSPGLVEADLMRRVLPAGEFARWWDGFAPSFSADSPLASVVDVPPIADGHVVHLHGLNLSRAGALARLSQALGRPAMLELAHRLYRAGAQRSWQGAYAETHWLPTFTWDAAVSLDAAPGR
ncbi:MAG TPA: DUF2891 family protein [Candidatus Cybelea sp.]|nr:DUF2891 family protein [Candidatus Cybelea sp.]